jgi:cytochrome d ubiquinol oxidase subunit I
MLFGIGRVRPAVHFGATVMVAFGTALSSFWILSVNSWLQTPVGFEINEAGQFVPGGSWWTIIFNPSFPYRFAHTVVAAYLTTALAVGAIGAWHLLRDRRDQHARTMFSMAMWMAALTAPVQIFLGDLHGLNTLEHQPVKVMAMEGHFESYPDGAPLILFGVPDEAERRVDWAVEIPKLSSLILKHDPDAPLAGLDTVPDDREPPVAIVFYAFRVMVGMGMLMLGLGLWSLYARWRGRLYDSPTLHRAAVAMGPSGFVAVIAGWITTEVGRQPYTVYGHMLTADSLSPVGGAAVLVSLVAFVVVYTAVFGAGTAYILKLVAKGARPHESDPSSAPIRTAGITPGPAIDAGLPRLEVRS